MLCFSLSWWSTAASSGSVFLLPLLRRGFRSPAALEALEAYIGAAEGRLEKPRLVLYNYPSFAGAFAALFAHLYHSSLNLPCLVLPFSSVEPLRVEDCRSGVIGTCYLLDFVGPKGFAVELAKIIPRVIAFDHRLCTLSRISNMGKCPNNLELRIDTTNCSTRAVLNYFSKKFTEEKSSHKDHEALLNLEDQIRVEKMIRYIEDADLRRWELVGIKEFEIGIREARAKLNTVTNPYVFEQAIRADGNAELSHEIAVELSSRSAAAGLRPIGAVVFMQRGKLKMCLRTTDTATDTSEIAKAYGGGGKPRSSSFIIRMDEYNEWMAVNSL